ncbi:hypothetical protein TVAG_345920 [Trichomonas vaginalis G3]|uniref:DUF3447 domain-containing protein n=1 Tax=Trichomonas vaginalis (strain ATCC PRA-98 / G3) TaxID=412133 RepID=A2F4X9_TRIV3|nr:protein ubiquitination [Trichomonas vaginalis G3]EAY00044.1 hypothetical protein TVAG_345920 [Trichomonas vaginalis G3]KAI5483106.1 protein ubiquitination [Trichomonas vaginalis G3]|eukprot:XP_001312973.1 hypothetical protein [Trichomonas vaginalis G3]
MTPEFQALSKLSDIVRNIDQHTNEEILGLVNDCIEKKIITEYYLLFLIDKLTTYNQIALKKYIPLIDAYTNGKKFNITKHMFYNYILTKYLTEGVYDESYAFCLDDVNSVVAYDDIEKLRNISISPNFDPSKYLEFATKYGSISCFKFLINNCACEVSEQAVQYAFVGNNLEIIHILERDYPGFINQRCLDLSLANHHHETSQYLIDKYDFKITFHFSLCYYNFGFFFKLFDTLGVNSLDSSGDNPLKAAAMMHCPFVCHYLIEKGADVNMNDSYGRNALHFAIHQEIFTGDEAFETIDLLVKNGSDLNSIDRENKTIIMYCAMENQFKCARYLLERGCLIDHVDLEGKSALILATFYGYPEVVKVLLEYNSSIYSGFCDFFCKRKNSYNIERFCIIFFNI